MKRSTVMDVCKMIVESIQKDAGFDIFADFVCGACFKGYNSNLKPAMCDCGSIDIRVPCVSHKDLRIAIMNIQGGDHRTLKAWKEHLDDFGFMREVNQYAYSFREGKKHFKLKKLEMFSKEIKGENDGS